jgi:hypothetical protein
VFPALSYAFHLLHVIGGAHELWVGEVCIVRVYVTKFGEVSRECSSVANLYVRSQADLTRGAADSFQQSSQ